MNNTRHIPVLFHEVEKGLHITPGATVVDATLGGGGHTTLLVEAVGKGGRVIALDRDLEAIRAFQKRSVVPENLKLVHANYSRLAEVLQELGIEKVDAILADLGFSSDQIESPQRGMSFLVNGPLDMRLDQSEEVTAATLLNTWSKSELIRIFREYGEEKAAVKITNAIVRARAEKPFATTQELASLVERIAGGRKGEKKHPATKVFQALRIAVNQEREHLARFLESTKDTLQPGGRLAIMSFHSGEDRMVKEFLAEAGKACICPREFPVCRCDQKPAFRLITRKAIRPTAEEVAKNPRARSAVLRLAERI